jgi:ABC-type transporter MlaC component
MASGRRLHEITTLVALIVLLVGLPAAAVPDVRGELNAVVGEFNAYAQQLDSGNVASVKAFNEFIRTRVARHWDTEHMATQLLGDDVFARLSRDQQWQIQQRLETTFYRYNYEILDAYQQAPLALVDDLYPGEDGQLQIKILGKPRILPALTGNLYINKNDDSWVIVDAGYAGWTYISLKRRVYQRKLARRGVDGLLAWLDAKNQRFFAGYCQPDMLRVMPDHVAVLCERS